MKKRSKLVVPAILTDDPKAFEVTVRKAESFTDYVQLDIMDGQFVPSRSITCDSLAHLSTKLSWEAHLMVRQPGSYFEGCRKAGAEKVIFHYEATDAPREVISLARGLNLEVGLAINPETPLPAFLPLADEVDSILFLSVHPGFYGSKFIPEVLDKVVELRSRLPDMLIGIDGGIKENNIARVARSGVDVIFVGSAIFLQTDPAECFRHLLALAEKGARQTKG